MLYWPKCIFCIFPLAICINFPSVLNDFALQSGSKTSVHFIEVTKSHPAIQQYSQWNLEKSNNYSFDLIPVLFYLFICLLIYLKPGVLFFFFFLNVKTIPGWVRLIYFIMSIYKLRVSPLLHNIILVFFPFSFFLLFQMTTFLYCRYNLFQIMITFLYIFLKYL